MNLLRQHLRDWIKAQRNGITTPALWETQAWLDLTSPGPSECGATRSTVIGRCGRDAGHDGDHRSTGPTFAVSWTSQQRS